MSKFLLHFPRNMNRCLSIYLIIAIYIIIDTFGILIHFLEKDFFNEFSYPYNGDIQNYVGKLRMNITPDVHPINDYNYSLQNFPKMKCSSTTGWNSIRLVYLIKSSVKNHKNRIAIRRTWGYEHRFSDVEIRTVFLVGKSYNIEWDENVAAEAEAYKDIVVINYYDNYYNNTIKTMMGFKWAVTFCTNAQFYMFADDDYYISTKNVLRFIRNPTNYPEYIKQIYNDDINKAFRGGGVEYINFNLATDVRLYSGFVFQTSPHRHKISKWYVPLDEYPYHLWPPYVTAGAYVLSKEALVDLFYASYYTKHFRFDDIYVGLLAFKAHIEPLHCGEFYYHKKEIDDNTGFEFTIASHGYENPDELTSVWNIQKGKGNA